MKLEDFGNAENPLRPSALAWLIRCPVKAVFAVFDEIDDAGGPAAQTGSVVHAAVAAFHLEPDAAKKIGAAVAAMQQAAGTFPLHDPKEARLYLDPYLADPRNAQATFAVAPRDYKRKDGSTLYKGQPAIEVPVELWLEAHRLDPTGVPIRITGTLDQIRRDADGAEVVDDLKTGQTTGWAMIHDYAFQQAAYALAARESGFPDALPGRLIRAYGYRARGAKLPSPDGVFWALPFDADGARMLMDHVRLRVALIRSGEVDFGPGPQCSYCPLGGLDSCVPLANRKLFSLPMS